MGKKKSKKTKKRQQPKIRIVPDTEGFYGIDRKGNVYRRKGGRGAGGPFPRLVKKKRNPFVGYNTVSFSIHGKKQSRRVDILVMNSFGRRRPLDFEIEHLDGDNTNDSLKNLRYEHPLSIAPKPSHIQRRIIRALIRDEGFDDKLIAKELEVSLKAVIRIHKREDAKLR